MSPPRRPRAIPGSAGSRVKVLLGASGTDFCYFLDEDDGHVEWQTSNWAHGEGHEGVPAELAEQINKCSQAGRIVTDVAFGPQGEWYLNSQKCDNSAGERAWFGGVAGTASEAAGDNIRNNKPTSSRQQVVFGDDGRFVVINGRRGSSWSSNTDSDLIKRIRRVTAAQSGKTVDFVRFFPHGGYMISDSDGIEWKEGFESSQRIEELREEIYGGSKEPLLDVTVAGDGNWIVIRPTRFEVSDGVSGDLRVALAQFYKNHQKRKSNRSREIAAYNKKIKNGEMQERRGSPGRRSRRDRCQKAEASSDESGTSVEERRSLSERHEAEPMSEESGTSVEERLVTEEERKTQAVMSRLLVEEQRRRDEEERRLTLTSQRRNFEWHRSPEEEKVHRMVNREQHARQEIMRRLSEERMKERRAEEVRLDDLRAKRIKVGDRVTAVGISKEPGDTFVTNVYKEGRVALASLHSTTSGSSVIVRDPNVLTRFESQEEGDVEGITFLCLAADKYEAAVSFFRYQFDGSKVRSACLTGASKEAWQTRQQRQAINFHNGKRVCLPGIADATIIEPDSVIMMNRKRIMVILDDGSSHYALKELLQHPGQLTGSQMVTCDNDESVSSAPGGQTVFHVRPLLEHRGEVQPIDEYKCAEKIDLNRLEEILAYLTIDREEREDCLEILRRKNTTAYEEDLLNMLNRCRLLDATVCTLHTLLKDVECDKFGCVVYEVEYDHRDPSFRGRMFAIGPQVRVPGDKYPRTATIQAMPSDLRAPLVGQFAHDVDCENSEVRVLCSLALQLGLTDLIPTFFDYRDNRVKWLRRIAHFGVSEADAKRLPIIILNGGLFETWLSVIGRSECPATTDTGREIRGFVVNLYSEIRALRDKVLRQRRFKWISIGRERLEQDVNSGGAVESLLMGRVIQSCENEVLGIMHRRFFDLRWRVRSKLFDSLIVEPGPDTVIDLGGAMRAVEESCRGRGWDIRLVEKPLHGRHNAPVKTIVDAREAIQQLKGEATLNVQVGVP